MRQTYTPAETDLALLTLALTGRNCNETARRLKGQGLTVSPRVLRNWRDLHAERTSELEHDHAPLIEKAMMNSARAIATRAGDVTLAAIDAAEKQLREGEAKDPSTVARNLSVAAGIHTDKALVLDGRPTSIVAGDGQTELLNTIARLLGKPEPSIDSTATEYEPSLPREIEG